MNSSVRQRPVRIHFTHLRTGCRTGGPFKPGFGLSGLVHRTGAERIFALRNRARGMGCNRVGMDVAKTRTGGERTLSKTWTCPTQAKTGLEWATRRAKSPSSVVLGPGLGTVAQGDEEDGALAFGVRGEERCNVVVEKRQAGGTQALRICGEIELAADDAGLELHGAISAIAIALQDGPQIGQKEDVDRSVGGQCLLQSQISGLRAEVASLQ